MVGVGQPPSRSIKKGATTSSIYQHECGEASHPAGGVGRASPTAARLEAALATGDPDSEVTVAWWAAQQLCLAYAKADPAAGRAKALIDQLADCPVRELGRLRSSIPPAIGRSRPLVACWYISTPPGVT